MRPGTVVTISDKCVWRERRGLTATVVDTSGCRVYPVHGLGAGETIVYIKDDPICGYKLLDGTRERWTCVMNTHWLRPTGDQETLT